MAHAWINGFTAYLSNISAALEVEVFMKFKFNDQSYVIQRLYISLWNIHDAPLKHFQIYNNGILGDSIEFSNCYGAPSKQFNNFLRPITGPRKLYIK